MTVDLTLFHDLDRLRQTGNFSRAAQIANISQSAYSRRIQALEAWVGVQLVNRSRQPVVLTDAGRQMLEAGLQAAARVETERSQILETQSLPDRYVVTFGAQHSIGWRFFPAWLQSLEDGYGQFLSRLRADDLPNCMAALRNHEIDFVIFYQGLTRTSSSFEDLRGFETVRIGQDRLIPVCKADAQGDPVYQFAHADQTQLPFLRFSDTAPLGQHLTPIFQRFGLHKRLRTVYENSMSGALRMRARDGAGVAWLPESLVAPDIAAGALTRTGADDWAIDLQITLMRDPQHSNHLTRSVWGYLLDRDAQSSMPNS